VLICHTPDLAGHLIHFVCSPLDRGRFAAFALPALDVPRHLVPSTLLLLDVVTQLAGVWLRFRFVHQFETAGFAHAVFFVALLAEVTPSPVATGPAGLFKVTHDSNEMRLYLLVLANPVFRYSVSNSSISTPRTGNMDLSVPHHKGRRRFLTIPSGVQAQRYGTTMNTNLAETAAENEEDRVILDRLIAAEVQFWTWCTPRNYFQRRCSLPLLGRSMEDRMTRMNSSIVIEDIQHEVPEL
jgi:hypothetical protein